MVCFLCPRRAIMLRSSPPATALPQTSTTAKSNHPEGLWWGLQVRSRCHLMCFQHQSSVHTIFRLVRAHMFSRGRAQDEYLEDTSCCCFSTFLLNCVRLVQRQFIQASCRSLWRRLRLFAAQQQVGEARSSTTWRGDEINAFRNESQNEKTLFPGQTLCSLPMKMFSKHLYSGTTEREGETTSVRHRPIVIIRESGRQSTAPTHKQGVELLG